MTMSERAMMSRRLLAPIAQIFKLREKSGSAPTPTLEREKLCVAQGTDFHGSCAMIADLLEQRVRGNKRLCGLVRAVLQPPSVLSSLRVEGNGEPVS